MTSSSEYDATTTPHPEPPRLRVVPPQGDIDAAKLSELEDEITSLAGHLAAGTARFLSLLRAFDEAGGWQAHGLRSCAQWLSWKCGMSVTTAREHVRVAESIAPLPVLQEAFSAGRLSFSKVRAITRVATPETEAELVETAQVCTASQLDRLCTGLKRARSNEEVLNHRAGARFTATWRPDGTLSFSGRLAPEDGAALLAALAAFKPDPVRREGVPPADGQVADGQVADGLPDDRYRDPGMLAARADAEALVMLARHALDTPPPAVLAEPVRLLIHADEASTGQARPSEPATESENAPAGAFSDGPVKQSGPQDVAAVLDAGPSIPLLPLSPATFERLACGAIVESATDPDDAAHDNSDRRFANRKQRRALLRRDGGCRFAGCTRKRGLHAHHVVHYSKGGATTMANLVLLCDHHHLLVHEGGWRLEHTAGGWVAVSPSGDRHIDAPAISGDPDRLSSEHGAVVGPETVTGSWAGDAMNLGYAVGAFVQRR